VFEGMFQVCFEDITLPFVEDVEPYRGGRVLELEFC